MASYGSSSYWNLNDIKNNNKYKFLEEYHFHYFDCLVYSGISTHLFSIQAASEEDNIQQIE